MNSYFNSGDGFFFLPLTVDSEPHGRRAKSVFNETKPESQQKTERRPKEDDDVI